MKLILKNSIAVLALSGEVAVTANQALAGGFAIREQSALGLGMAFAGAAAGYDNDLSAIFFNPATLALNSGFNAQAEASVIAPNSKISVTSGGPDSGNIGKLAVVPSTYVGYQVNSNFSFGVGVNAPFGLVTEANTGWGGSTHALKSELKNFNLNPVMSYRLNSMISIGLGVQIDYLEAELTNFAGAPGIATMKGKDKISFGLTAGVLFEPTPMTRVGIGYRSHIKHKLKGNLSFTAAPTLPITADFTSPETVTFSLQQKINDKFTVMGSVEWANWSRFKNLTVMSGGAVVNNVHEGWKDSWFLSAGAEYKPTPASAIRIGAAYEKSPVPDSTRLS